MAGFSRQTGIGATSPCKSPCATARDSDDNLSAAVQARIKSLTGRPEPATGLQATDDAPMLISADSSPCQRSALTLGPTLRRFNRYREALPAARAAGDMNQRLGATVKDKDKAVDAPCLTRLPTSAAELNRELGLPDGTIKPEHLRQEDTGFRAAMYRDESTGRLLLVARDTQPTSLVDWQTNTRNGDGEDTDQYQAARVLASRLTLSGVPFDVAGYSKGGGLAQEMALVNPQAKAYVFNSAGLHENSLARTGATDFNALVTRTQAFSAKDDFLTYMNNTTDPAQQVANAQFLRRELAGDNRWGPDPMAIDHRSPAMPKASKDASFEKDRQSYFDELDAFAKRLEDDAAAGRRLRSFPPVRAAQKEVIPGSASRTGNFLGASDPGPNLGKLNQHLMANVLDPMEKNVKQDREALQGFLRACP